MAEIDVLTLCVEHVQKDIVNIKQELKELNVKIELYYLTVKQYESEITPLKKIVYGMVSLVMGSVGLALIYLVINKGGIP